MMAVLVHKIQSEEPEHGSNIIWMNCSTQTDVGAGFVYYLG